MGDEVRMLQENGADVVHCDVMDGVFVPNISFGFPVMKPIRKASDKVLDVHLMIVEPEKYVAQFAEAGADIVNDIGGLAEHSMRELCAAQPCGIILMHMQGTPATMQQAPQYNNVVAEVRDFFTHRVKLAEQAGIDRRRICLDPGIGFGKTTEHNLALIAHLAELRVDDLPLMMALSRKRFISSILGSNAPAKTDPLPTVALSLLAAERGADLHRVHDIEPLHRALTLRHALNH